MLLAERIGIEKAFYMKLFSLRIYHLFLRARYTDWERKSIPGNKNKIKNPKTTKYNKNPLTILFLGIGNQMIDYHKQRAIIPYHLVGGKFFISTYLALLLVCNQTMAVF